MATSPQRAYRAACPNCGAPVEFASAASASAVCSFCRSTLVRDGEALRRIGVSAELFDDHSPLQLGASGRYQGLAFTLVGRLQLGYADGTWNEWHALFDSGRSGWLSEDNGAYVFGFDAPWPADAPAADAVPSLAVGQPCTVDGRGWTVAAVVHAQLIAAQGELPQPPPLGGAFTVVELRNVHEEVGTLDYGDPRQPHWSTGRAVLLADLALSGLRDVSEKALERRAFACPGCGAPLELRLATTQAISCDQCNTVVDVSQGIAGELEHYRQNNIGAGGLQPLIPLGRSGRIAFGAPAALDWQLVGYQERCDLPEPGDDEEQVFWREYLLYNREHGFAFLVDAEDGWSWMRPITGTPAAERGDRVGWRGASYDRKYSYRARVTWVQGEFYWRVRRNEEARVTDYVGTGAASRRRLSLEQTAGEAVWSAGEAIDADVVAKAFGVDIAQQAAFGRDVAPLALQASMAAGKMTRAVLMMIVFVMVMIALATCSTDDCEAQLQTFGAASAEYQQCLRNSGSGSGARTSGSSWGGYSSGGGHK